MKFALVALWIGALCTQCLAQLEPCKGSVLPGGAQCSSLAPEECSNKFAKVSTHQEAQCGLSGPNCLTIGPLCDAGSLPTWHLVMKVGSQTDKLGYSSALWTNSELLNEGSPAEDVADAKYEAYLNVPFNEIRMCVGSPDKNCVTHKFEKTYDSAKELFSAGYIRDETVKRDEILQAFGPQAGSYQDCPMQRPGFNIQCKDSNWARWGFCLNCASQGCQNDDSNDADAAIGIGLRGQSTNPPEMGAGWTEYFASGKGTCNHNSKTYKSVWVWVLGATKLEK